MSRDSRNSLRSVAEEKKVGLKVLMAVTPDLDPGGIEIGQRFEAHYRVLCAVTGEGPFGPAAEVGRGNENGRFGIKCLDARSDDASEALEGIVESQIRRFG